jgi:hypothetical protein
MNALRWITVTTVIGFACMAVVVWSSRGGEGAPVATSDIDRFEGKWLAVELDRALDQHTTWIHDSHVQTLGNESFLIGKSFSLTSEGKNEDGETMLVPIHHIEQIYVYDNLEQVKKIFQKEKD